MKFKVMILFIISVLLILVSGCAQPNDPESPETGTEYLELQAVYETEGYVADLEVYDDCVYIAEDEGGFSIFDAQSDTLIVRQREYFDGADTISFTNIKKLAVDEESNKMLIYNKYSSHAGIHVFDITDRTYPIWRLWHTGNSADISDLKVTSIDSTHFQYYWVNLGTEYSSGKFIKNETGEGWSISSELENYFGSDIVNFDEHLDTGIIYCASKQLGMRIVEKLYESYLTFPLLGTISTIGQTITVKVVDNIAYLGNREEGVNVVDISDLNNPIELFNYDTTGLASDLAVNAELNIFALASTSGGVYLFSGPEGEIRRLQRIDDSEIGYTNLVRLRGNLLYVGTRYGVYKYAIINL